MKLLNNMKVNQYIDHTLLKPTATSSQIKDLCTEAIEHEFFAVCVNPHWVALAAKEVKNSDVKVAVVVGFPLGANTSELKVAEARLAIKDGAHEVDMVINHAFIAEGNYQACQGEIRRVKKAIGKHILKVILETCYLSNEEIIKASKICVAAGADFVKTSTGFGTEGATYEHIKIMKEAVNGQASLKASGGVRDYETAKRYIEMGVSRLGTSSGIAIINGEESKVDY